MVVLCSTLYNSLLKAYNMDTRQIMTDMGIMDAVLGFHLEAQMLKSIAHSECKNISELMAHWAKEPTAFNWAIGEFGMQMIEQAISDVCEAEFLEQAEKNPIAMMMAMMHHIAEEMG